MEIISYVLDGELAHKDSIGNGAAIAPGEVQRMSAGRGIMHSEYNHAPDQTTHFLQIWIEPDRRGIEPGYEQKAFAEAEKRGRLKLVASPDGRDGSVTLHISPVAGFQGLMRVQDALTRVRGVREAGVEAYAQGEARLRLQLVERIEPGELAASLGASLGRPTRLTSASTTERVLQVALE